MPRAGWKICINDPRVQKKLGLEGSFVGFLDGSRHLASGDTWMVEEGSVLGVEPEFAVRFAAAVHAADSAEVIRRAIEGVAPAIEIVDWRGATFDLPTIAASSSFHAGFVVGQVRSLDAVPAIAGCVPLFRRGQQVLGAPDACLVPADLTALVAHVARFLSRYDQRIQAGDWLLCGACTSPARVEAGDVIEADFGTLGGVRVRFAG